MKFSVISTKQVDLNDRIDAEYFQPDLLYITEKLEALRSKPLNKYCKVTASAFYPAATDLYSNGDVPFIRVSDCIDYPVISTYQDSSFVKIPTSFLKENKNVKVLKKNEIVISKVGTPCYSSIVTDMNEVALSRTVLGLKEITGIDEYFLLAFLRSKYGFNQLVREQELTIQLQLTLDRTARILVFKPSYSFQTLIGNLIREYIKLLTKSNENYSIARKLLLDEVGFYDEDVLSKNTYTKNYSDASNFGRFDAEYFLPKYEAIEKKIKSYSGGWLPIASSVKINDKNFLPEDGTLYKYVELSNISSNGEISGYTEDYGGNLPTRARRQLALNDVIISSIEGSLKSVAIVKNNDEDYICSNGFYVIKSKVLNPETFLVLMKLEPFQYLLKKGCSGTILSAIPKNEILKIPIPKVSNDIQSKVQEIVHEMFNMKAKSRSLLVVAKHGIEKAIEENEEVSRAWIKDELYNLGFAKNDF